MDEEKNEIKLSPASCNCNFEVLSLSNKWDREALEKSVTS